MKILLLTKEIASFVGKHSEPVGDDTFELKDIDGLSKREKEILMELDELTIAQTGRHCFINYQLLLD